MKLFFSIIRCIAGVFLSLILATTTVCNADNQPDHSDSGLPFYSVYSLDSLGRGSVNVSFSEDKNGQLLGIYNSIIMVFDGKAWSMRVFTEGSDSDSVLTASMGKDGVFYAGSVGRWGRLDVIPSGDFVFKSFSPDNAPKWTSSARFEHMLTTGDGAFFLSIMGVVHQSSDGKTCHFWNDIQTPTLIFEDGSNVYLSSESGGIFILKNWKWEPIPNTERYGGKDVMFRQVKCEDGHLILATASGKLFQFDGKTLIPWKTDADTLLSKGIVDMIALPSSEIAIAVRGYGIVVIDACGRITMRIGTDHDSAFAGISNLHEQENGVIWASLSNGVAKIYYPSQVTFYDHRFGISMYWPQVYKYKGSPLIYSDHYMYLASYDEMGCIKKFEELDIANGDPIDCCLGLGNELFYSTSGTVYCYDASGKTSPIVSGISSVRIRTIKGQPDYIVVFGIEKHALLHRVEGKWTVAQIIPSSGFPSMVFEAKNGDMWIEHGLGRVSMLRMVEGKLTTRIFDNIEGLAHAWVNVWELGGQIYLCADKVIKRYDYAQDKLIPAPEMLDLLQQIGDKVSRLYEAPNGTVWASNINGVVLILNVDGKTMIDRETLRPVSESHSIIQFDEGGVVWLTSGNRIVRYDGNISKVPHYRDAKPVISLAASSERSTHEMNIVNLDTDASKQIDLPYKANNLVLHLFPNTYSLAAPPSYHYMLEGLSNTWTPPGTDTTINLSNLHEGSYRLNLEVLYHGLPMGSQSSYAFKVEPPWARTWWAYTLYLILLVALILSVVRISQIYSARERKLLEETVATRTRDLQNALEARRNFLANVSHEIRTPLNGIVGMAQALRDTKVSPDQRDSVDTIVESSNNLVATINDILDVSDVESGKVVLAPCPVFMQQFISEISGSTGVNMAVKGLDFDCSVQDGLPPALVFDPGRVKQVVLCLLSNAFKFTEKGKVTLRISFAEGKKGAGNLSFDVTDTGIGIAPGDQDRIFKPFEQVDGSHSRRHGGVGLGLTISQELAKLMSGRLSLQSESGRGSTFTFELPVKVSAPPPPVQPIDASEVEKNLRKLMTLVAEDNLVNQKVVGIMLKKLGVNADFAVNGEEAVKMAENKAYDVILMDIQMPVMDGLEATRRLRAELPEKQRPQIIALTAHARSEDVQVCLQAGMDAHMTKPVKTPDLYNMLVDACQKRHV